MIIHVCTPQYVTQKLEIEGFNIEGYDCYPTNAGVFSLLSFCH